MKVMLGVRQKERERKDPRLDGNGPLPSTFFKTFSCVVEEDFPSSRDVDGYLEAREDGEERFVSFQDQGRR